MLRVLALIFILIVVFWGILWGVDLITDWIGRRVDGSQ
jgi:preprotein translocase subunit SecE